MELKTLRDLYIHELKDLLSAENQLIKALPKMREAAKNRQLAAAFNQHLNQTKQQAKRLEQILKRHGESTRAPKCEGMEGLIKEGDKMAGESAQDDVRDAGLIASAQRVEHYEIAGYGCARTYAQLIGDKQGARSLDVSLNEEAATDKKLTKLARSIVNVKASKAPKRDHAASGIITRALQGVIKRGRGDGAERRK